MNCFHFSAALSASGVAWPPISVLAANRRWPGGGAPSVCRPFRRRRRLNPCGAA